MPISKLEEVGINAGDIKKLMEAGILNLILGFHTIESIQMTARKNMLNIKGLTDGKIDKVIEACFKLINNNIFISA